jgi:hypothetical protein
MEENDSESAQDLESQEIQEQLKEASKESAKLKEMEFRTLKAEELRRIEFRHTIIQLSLAGFGAILALGLQLKLSTILLLYPFLMLWLALLWRQNAEMLVRLRAYIATYIEVEEHQWERMLKTQFHPIWNYDTAFTFLFLCADLITLGIGISENPQNIVLIILSAFCTLITVLLLFVRRPITTELVDTPL